MYLYSFTTWSSWRTDVLYWNELLLENGYSNMTAYISSTSICRFISTFSTCALKLSIGNNKNVILKVSVMNKSLQGRFCEVIHNNYTLYYFVYMYTQICDANALIWGFPRRMFPVTSHVKFWRRKQPIFVLICEGG
jgi:hypothetical protein